MRTKEEYEAAATLLGMKFSKKSWAFYPYDNGLIPVKYYHPDTLEPLNARQRRHRAEWIELGEDPDRHTELP